MSATLLRAVAAALLLAATAAAEERPVQAYGEDHPDCREWTDGCIVCTRQADGSAACSMVGAACLPAAVVCLEGG